MNANLAKAEVIFTSLNWNNVTADNILQQSLGSKEQHTLNNLELTPPSGIAAVLKTLLEKMIDNPINALINANYIGLIIFLGGIGLALRHASQSTKTMMNDLSYAISFIVRVIIRFAPLGIFGLVASILAETGFDELYKYAHLLVVLVSCMLIVALVINPLLAYLVMRKNPYQLVFTSLKESAIPAFFTRSSAANIPVNIEICKNITWMKIPILLQYR